MVSSSDFVVLGLAEPGADHHQDALQPCNWRRAHVLPVLLTSNNDKKTDFTLVGPPCLLYPSSSDPLSQAAWLRNFRRENQGSDCNDSSSIMPSLGSRSGDQLISRTSSAYFRHVFPAPFYKK